MKGVTYQHQAVMLAEAIDFLVVKPEGIYIDGTFGRGGHSREILRKLNEHGLLIAMDHDPEAVLAAKATTLFHDPRFVIKKASFAELLAVVDEFGVKGKVQGVLLDLGVSSPQLDDPNRGFSFLRDGPLDMRMDTSCGDAAATWLATVDEKVLAKVLREYGEERYASRIARAIVHERAVAPIETTAHLAKIVAAASPTQEKHKHPATRCFQAIRIFINNELENLQQCLQQCYDTLAVGGRIVAISFHSLEDRIVKQFFSREAKGMNMPKKLPIREAEIHASRRMRILSKAVKPSLAEINSNPRARSAVLRVAEKIT